MEMPKIPKLIIEDLTQMGLGRPRNRPMRNTQYFLYRDVYKKFWEESALEEFVKGELGQFMQMAMTKRIMLAIEKKLEDWVLSMPTPPPYWICCSQNSEQPNKLDIHVNIPNFLHDCDECVFLGNYEYESRAFDLYYCPKEPTTVLARFGDEGPEYESGMSFVGIVPHLTEARRRWDELTTKGRI